jgi:hypothetical protein
MICITRGYEQYIRVVITRGKPHCQRGEFQKLFEQNQEDSKYSVFHNLSINSLIS